MAVVLMAGAFVFGVWVDQTFPAEVPILELRPQPRGQLDEATLEQARRIIEADYYGQGLDYSKLSQGSVRGMVQALGDPYSEYLDPEQFRRQQDTFEGRHTGVIGIFVEYRDGYPVVSGVLPDSPALAAGLRAGDVILRVDGTDVHGLQQEQTSALIRGAVGSTVTLRIRRGVSELEIRVTRADFKSPTVKSARLGGGVLYLRIYQFGNATAREFDDQLWTALPGARAVVLDLRDNGGGLLSAATSVISRFVAGGEAFEERGRGGSVQPIPVEGDHPAADLPLVVLVNGSTASAAEVVAGSLQAHGRAELVGTRTFGKGSVQVDFPLRDGGDLHLTVQHWWLPNGRSVEGSGLTPDVLVPLADRAQMFDVVAPQRGHAGDTQLARALQLLGAPVD